MYQIILQTSRFIMLRVAEPAARWGWRSKTSAQIRRYSTGRVPALTGEGLSTSTVFETSFTIGFWYWWLTEFAGSRQQKRLSAHLVYYTSSPVEGGFTLEKLIDVAVGEPDYRLLARWRGITPPATVPLPGTESPDAYSVRGQSGLLEAIFLNVPAIDP